MFIGIGLALMLPGLLMIGWGAWDVFKFRKLKRTALKENEVNDPQSTLKHAHDCSCVLRNGIAFIILGLFFALSGMGIMLI